MRVNAGNHPKKEPEMTYPNILQYYKSAKKVYIVCQSLENLSGFIDSIKSNFCQAQPQLRLAVLSQLNLPSQPATHPSEYQKSYIWSVRQQVSSRWKTTSPFEVNGRRPQFFLKMEDDLNFFENGRRPQFF